MNPDKQPEKPEGAKKILLPIILSTAFLAASGILLYGTNQFEDEINKLEDEINKLEDAATEYEESVNELGKTLYDYNCKKEFEFAIKKGQIPQPITKESLLSANISTDLTYSDEMPLPEMTKWVESFGPEYNVADGKLDCSYLVLQNDTPAP